MTKPPRTSPRDQRQAAFSALENTQFDMAVVGGGINGCGVARDAALRGYKVALIEKTDFGAGTSSRSSKLIHGGLRYLEHAKFRLVFEGTNERALLMRLAPHLVKPLPFLVPAYKESRPGLLKLDVGLWIYDALAGFKSFKLHRTYRAEKVLELEPILNREALKGGIVYYDCLTDDARLTLENALDARSLGAVVVNSARAVGLVKDSRGTVTGVELEDAEPGTARRVTVRARVVVNATGPWTDQLRAQAGQPAIVKPSLGIHLVIDSARLPLTHAVVMLARQDHRVLFAIPWGKRTVLGTTDTFFDGDPDRVFASAQDVDYLIETANYYFPNLKLGRDDVLATWAGLRPLLAPSKEEADASDVSREHEVFESPGFVTIAGGKLTTYRRIAAEVVDAASRQLPKRPPCSTAERSLPGAQGIASEEELADLTEVLRKKGVQPLVARHCVDTYGVRATDLADRLSHDPTAAAPLDPELPFVMAETDEAVEHEMGLNLIDVLSRRVPLLLKARDQGLGVAPAVADRMGKLLGWSSARRDEEVERYRAEVNLSRRFRSS